MGKREEVQLDIPEDGTGGAGGGGGLYLLRPCTAALAGIGKAFTLRCAVVLVLSACVLLSAIFWLPPFHSFRSGFAPSDPDSASAEIQASFILQKPISLLAAERERLEYDIFEEIGIPNTKVSIVSMHSLAQANSTYVVFGVLPDSRYALISAPALSVLKSSLVELVLQQLNLSLTPSLFGHPSFFELLKFPGGITVIPVPTASIWERAQALFNFTLNNSIVQIQKNLDQLNYQLKYGLNLRSDENVYVQMINVNGSTVAPPVTVQASVMSDVGRSRLLPYRLKQLAQVIRGHHAKNLGLNHSVFGKVNEVRLSSYLQDSISSLAPSPSPSPSSTPSPSPSEDIPYTAPPVSSNPTLSPSHAPSPSTNRHYQPPCFNCDALSPSGSPISYAHAPENGPQPPSQSLVLPGPSVTNSAPSPAGEPCHPPSLPPRAFRGNHLYAPVPSEHSPYSAIPPQHKQLGPASQLTPKLSPSSPAVAYGTSPVEGKGSGMAPTSPSSMLSLVSPSSTSSSHREICLIVWLGLLFFHLQCSL